MRWERQARITLLWLQGLGLATMPWHSKETAACCWVLAMGAGPEATTSSTHMAKGTATGMGMGRCSSHSHWSRTHSRAYKEAETWRNRVRDSHTTLGVEGAMAIEVTPQPREAGRR
mmetsp:Transcript_834/g.1257  ORF Transcript_834/g.1257 Transcript_834/m.1257 type:complete len:116 (+) Transcript_834:1458-1805(+)